MSDALFSSAVRAARSVGVSACATASATASGVVKMLVNISPGLLVVVVSKVSGGVVVRGVSLVDVTGGNVGVVVDVWGGVVACGRGGIVVRVVVTSTVLVDTFRVVVVSIVSDTGSVVSARVVDDASLVDVDDCRVVGGRLVVGRSLDEGTGSDVEGATF